MELRSLFPIFENQRGLIYLDNAATTQRVQTVVEEIDKFNSRGNATIHRGVYDLSSTATLKYEEVRKKVANFLGVGRPETIAFTKGTTESINVIAQSYLKSRLKPGDNIVITVMEHHANFVPWQVLCQEMGCKLRVAPLNDFGELDIDTFQKLIDRNTRMVAITHISNVLGIVNPIEELIDFAHAKGAPVLIDAAQSAALHDLDVKKYKYDFLAFSGHKIFGPFGVGLLYTNPDFIGEMKPYALGGGIIRHVSADKVTFQAYPHNLDAGTPNISGVLGLGAAIDFLKGLHRKMLRKYVSDLSTKCKVELSAINEVELLVESNENVSSIVSFSIHGIHPHDVASYLNADGIAVRAGNHCAQPLHVYLDTPSSLRVSFSIYNTENEIDVLINSIKSLIKFWKSGS
ncbi:MAG: cysteine desulfurase [Bacteroidota bacterium]